MSSTIKEINENLIKWKNVCIAMGANEDIAVIEDIIKIINIKAEDKSPKTKGKKNEKPTKDIKENNEKAKKEDSEKTTKAKANKISEKAVKPKNNKASEKTVKAKNKNIEELSEILEAYNNKDYEKFSKFKLSFLKIDANLTLEWDKLLPNKKELLSRLELSAIYNILYKPKEIKFINKARRDTVHDINYYINNEKRNNALKESKLI